MERIVFVTASLAAGGAERHSVTLMNRLAERRHECHAAYVKPETDLLDEIRLRDGGSVCALQAERYYDRRAVQGFAAWLRRIAPGAVVAANPYALMYAQLALRLARLRAARILTFHSTRLLGVKDWLQMLAYRPLAWSADALVFVSRAQARYWQRRALFARSVQVIPNGVDTERFSDRSSAEERAARRAALGIGPHDYVIGASAGLRPEKNHRQLLEALAALHACGLPARALLIGEGPMRGALEAQARALGIADAVRFAGFHRDVRPWLACCDVVASCSLTEAMPLAPIEAMAMARPVVHSDVGGVAELIEHGANGFLYPRRDTRALVGLLARLADPQARAPLAANARETVLARFSERAMVDRYEALICELGQARGAAVRPDYGAAARR